MEYVCADPSVAVLKIQNIVCTAISVLNQHLQKGLQIMLQHQVVLGLGQLGKCERVRDGKQSLQSRDRYRHINPFAHRENERLADFECSDISTGRK